MAQVSLNAYSFLGGVMFSWVNTLPETFSHAHRSPTISRSPDMRQGSPESAEVYPARLLGKGVVRRSARQGTASGLGAPSRIQTTARWLNRMELTSNLCWVLSIVIDVNHLLLVRDAYLRLTRQ